MAAAMRLCGRALRRTQQAATEQQQRQLFPRRFSFFRTRPITIEEQKDGMILLEQIEEKKEELYEMISDVVSRYKVHGKVGRENILLLERLAVQVEPRPGDAYWRSCQRTERTNRVLSRVGSYSLAFASPFGLYWLNMGVWPIRRKTRFEEWWERLVSGK
ncbi:unnamed protein product [Alopecurus aequalis]